MKQLLAILLITVMVGCSSDDSSNSDNPDNGGEQNTVLNLEKITTVNSLTNYTTISYFNEDGTVQRRLGYTAAQNEEDSAYGVYEYNNDLNLTSIKFYDADGQFDRDWRLFSYDSQGKLVTITDYGDGSQPAKHINFTYSENRVDFLEEETSRSGYILFDSEGKITETAHDENAPGTYVYHNFGYENGKVATITDSYGTGTTYTYTLDSNPNPLFQNFISNPIQYMLLEQYLFDIDFTFGDNFLQNNAVHVTSTYENTVSDHDVTTYTYNNNNYPTSSSTIRQNGSTVTRTYQYY